MYWISRDFFDKFEDSPNPELKRIKDIRDALEHKYVKITDIFFENEYANNMYETSELDYLIYNEPTSYVKLLLSGKMEEYLRSNTDYTPLSDMR